VLLPAVAEAGEIVDRARGGTNVKFRDVVLKSVYRALSLLASEGVWYPSVVVTGGAAILLEEPRLEGVYHTGDVDISAGFSADLDEIFLTLTELERKHPEKIFVLGVDGVVRFVPLEEGALPVDFIHPTEAGLREVFRYTHQNARANLASMRIGKRTTVVRTARLEDAILCKLAVHRKKDIDGLKQIVPKLRALGRLDWGYMGDLAKRFGLEKEMMTLREASS
jgi:hypothetical protein